MGQANVAWTLSSHVLGISYHRLMDRRSCHVPVWIVDTFGHDLGSSRLHPSRLDPPHTLKATSYSEGYSQCFRLLSATRDLEPFRSSSREPSHVDGTGCDVFSTLNHATNASAELEHGSLTASCYQSLFSYRIRQHVTGSVPHALSSC